MAVLVARSASPGGQEPKPPGDAPPIKLGEPLRIEPRDDPLQKALKERYNEALAEARERHQSLLAGRMALDQLFDVFQRYVFAGLEVAETPAAQVALLKQYVALAKNVEDIVAARLDAGSVTKADLHRARYVRHDAEVQLLRAQEKAKDKKRK
jgi:hypothetical protein